jgi:hypothetical protein
LKSGGNFFAKKFPPSPLQETPSNLRLAGFLGEETGKPEHIRSFWKGVWGGTFFKKVLPRLLS